MLCKVATFDNVLIENLFNKLKKELDELVKFIELSDLKKAGNN